MTPLFYTKVSAGASAIFAFNPDIERLLGRADAICRQRGVQLTDLRRQVLGLVLDSARPAGAYELLDRLRAGRRGAAPPTVYRSLEFLLEQGLVHKVERLSAFVGCIHAMEAAEDDHPAHAVQFLICKSCGRVAELSDHDIGHALVDAAGRVGFTVSGSTIEADGTCAACTGA